MKGPKTILADAISNALSDYFVVDKKSMETKLLKDAKLSLHDTELRPQENVTINPTTSASIRGVVQHVSFEWHWGKSLKDGGSDWVKDARLSISGLRFTVTLSRKEAEAYKLSSNKKEFDESKETPKSSTKTTGLMAYVQDQVQRILDTMTLSVENVLLTIVLPDGSNIQMGGSGMEISSDGFKYSEETPTIKALLQSFEMKQLYASVTTVDGEVYPIVDDIYYHATIQRSIGNRFVSGLQHGVRVNGNSDDNGVAIHAGPSQMEILNSLANILVQATPSQSSADSSDMSSDNVHSEQNSTTNTEVPPLPVNLDDGEPSFMGLKLSGVSLILPNAAKLSLSDLELKYRFDGSMLCVEGSNDFAVDGVPFLALGQGSVWILDFVHSRFYLEKRALNIDSQDPKEGQEVLAFVNARQREVNRVSEGMNLAFGIYQHIIAKNDQVSSQSENKKPLSTKTDDVTSNPVSWSIELMGKLGCIIEQEDGSEIVVMMQDLQANTESMTVSLKSLDECQIPGVLHLVEPIVDTLLEFKGSTVFATINDVVVLLDNSLTSSAQSNKSASYQESKSSSEDSLNDPTEKNPSTSEESSGHAAPLPFGLELKLKKLLAFQADGKTVHTTLDNFDVKIQPVDVSKTHIPANTNIVISLKEMNHNMLRLKETNVAFYIDSFSPLDCIHTLNFKAEEIAVAAGYSLSDWKALLPKFGQKRTADDKPIGLQNSHVEKLTVVVLVNGLIGVKDYVLRVKAFEGNEATTSKDLIRFYHDRVITKVPGMIANTQILGTRLDDGVVGHFGGGVLSQVLGGAGIGGLVSVAAFDGVKNTIKAGKVSRGVNETEKWKLSDLAFGLKHTAARVTKEGAAMRGKQDGDKASAVDWAVGATTDVAKYSNENKAKLAGAGAGAMGFATGFALGGPIGAIAGTIFASASTQKTVETVDGAFKKGRKHKKNDTTETKMEE